jgi:hypothetical protein
MVGVQEENTKRDNGLEKSNLNDQNVPNNINVVATPLWPSVGGEAQHFQSWGFGVLRDSRMFRVQQQGPKHLALMCSWCHWKGLEA